MKKLQDVHAYFEGQIGTTMKSHELKFILSSNEDMFGKYFQPKLDYEDTMESHITQIILVIIESEYTKDISMENLTPKIMVDYFDKTLNRLVIGFSLYKLN